jgi:hypothetical protein
MEWAVPAEQQAAFSFSATVVAVRMNGFFSADRLYLRHDAMLGMGFHTDDAPAPEIRTGMLQ